MAYVHHKRKYLSILANLEIGIFKNMSCLSTSAFEVGHIIQEGAYNTVFNTEKIDFYNNFTLLIWLSVSIKRLLL